MLLKRKFLNRGPLWKALNKQMFYAALEKHDSAGDLDPGVCVYMGDGRIRWLCVPVHIYIYSWVRSKLNENYWYFCGPQWPQTAVFHGVAVANNTYQGLY